MEEIARLKQEVPRIYGVVHDQAHDTGHLSRVYDMSMRLANNEGGDRLVIGAAAWLHDLHQIPEKKGGVVLSARDTLPQAQEILIGLNFPKYAVPKILHCIEVHEQYGFGVEGNNAETIEAKIIQDADNLDAMGSIGIARAFTFGGANCLMLWDGKILKNGFYDSQKIGENTLQHLYDKTMLLKDYMNTETAMKIAEGRHVFVEQFVDQFKKEWVGEL
tara:strand:- start:1310 stop:1963 length:654 start_codon:yes stop_codon:yes gene_type:complete